jgi:excisionase family DNA binding protein
MRQKSVISSIELARRRDQARRDVLTWKEAAGYLRISERTLRSWVTADRIVPCRIGPRRVVFLHTELDRFLEASMTTRRAAA